MKFLAAYLLASLSEEPVTVKKISSILSSVGIDSDDEKINLILSGLEGKTLDEVIAEGSSKLASVPAGGSAPAAAGSAGNAAGNAGGASAAPAEEAKEEEESDEDMGFGLFD
jgi:large subunit ribosomal protein LP2